jgi:3-dehydroquinate synthetase
MSCYRCADMSTDNVEFARTEHLLCVNAHQLREYRVALLDGFYMGECAGLAEAIRSRCALLVTTPTVAALYAESLEAGLRKHRCRIARLVLDCDESAKVPEQVHRICQAALEAQLDRNGVLIGFGGGICTDLVTCAASQIRRGIAHIRIPTTLTGQVDAGIGIKGAVNYCDRKSFLGCFHPPECVLIDPYFLRSLPDLPLRCGMAEIIKMAIIRDRDLFCLLERLAGRVLESRFTRPLEAARYILWRSIELMLDELEPNLYEDLTHQRLVDFGHFLSPLLEARSRFSLTHGEAVAIDMAATAALATEMKWLDAVSRDRIINLIQYCGLPLFASPLDEALCIAAADEAVRHRHGAMNMVLPIRIGKATFLNRRDEFDRGAMRRTLDWLEHRAGLPLPASAQMSAGMTWYDEPTPQKGSPPKQARAICLPEAS